MGEDHYQESGIWNLDRLIADREQDPVPEVSPAGAEPSEPAPAGWHAGASPAPDALLSGGSSPTPPAWAAAFVDARRAPARPGPPPPPPDPAAAPMVVAPHRLPGRRLPGRGRLYLYAGVPLAAVLVAVFAVVATGSLGRNGAAVTASAPAARVPPAALPAEHPSSGETAPGDPGGASPATAPNPAVSAADNEARALGRLNQLRAQDLPTVQFDGRYVAQLASKSVGIVDPYQTALNGTHTFYAADILAEHLQLRNGENAGARVVLVMSTDYGHHQLYSGKPLWVTFALGTFDSAAAVNSWCVNRFPQLTGYALTNQCAVRTLVPPQ